MRMTFYFIVTVFCIDPTQAYRFAIFEKTPPLCNNLTCKGNVQHTVCGSLSPSLQCRSFGTLKMSSKEMHTMILGHNGIRNKIAKDWGIANMNVLHWSTELARLSQHFLAKCVAKHDVCDFLVEKDITIGHNYFFSNAPPGVRWAGRALRAWYFELGYVIKSLPELKQARKTDESFRGFVQMIWPTAEFVGCAAAKMFNGYMVTCYYHPNMSVGWNDFQSGIPCGKCPELRPTCSRDFTRLCGLDLDIGLASRNYVHRRTLVICISLVFIIYRTSTILC